MNLPSGATSSKLLVPRPTADAVDRPLLRHRLDAIRRVRLTTVVAGTGFGKSTLVAGWAAEHPAAWYTVDRADRDPRVLAAGLTMALRVRTPALVLDPAVLAGGSPADDTLAAGLAGHLAESLSEHLRSDVALVVDDAQELDGSPGAPLLAALCRHAPSTLHLVLVSQSDAPFPIARLRAQSQVLEVGAAELGFSPQETAAVLAGALPEQDVSELAPLVHDVTAGWPAAVRMAVVALLGRPAAHRRAALERLSRPGSPLAELLAEEVFGALDEQETTLIVAAAQLDRFSVELLDAMDLAATAAIPRLARAGVLVKEEAEPGWYAVPPLVRTFVSARAGGTSSDAEAADRTARAAAWLEHRGAHREALALLNASGDAVAVADYISRHAGALVAAGAAVEVLDAIEGLPDDLRAGVVAPEVEARFASGDWDGVEATADRFPAGDLPPRLALRAGLVLHLRGRIHDGLATYTRGLGHDSSDPASEASILAYRAAAHWLLGNADACRNDAATAMVTAQQCADDAALAASHTVAAMIAAVDGDRAANEAHYVRALAHAEAAGDVLQIIRIRTNRGSRAIEEGAYDEGLTELDLAIGLAERSGYQSSAALALSNRAEAHLKLGRVDEAARDLDAAVTRYAVLGSRLRAYPLTHLGDLHLLRGERAQAHAAYSEALRLAEEAGDLQGLAPCLAGLAELLVDEDLDAAATLAERALAIEPSLARTRALWAAGLVAVRRGDPREAVEALADQLAQLGRDRRDRAATASGLELRAIVAEPAAARTALREAHDLWRGMSEPAEAARAAVALAMHADGVGEAEAAALLDEAEAIVRRLGARSLSAPLDEARRRLERIDARPVRIVTLGGFRVFRDGDPIAATAWQSRKARDLLKLLTSRLGRPLPREQVCEVLWPDEPIEKRSSRLSVTLSTLRSVLDPGRQLDADAVVAADRDHVWLELSATDLDVARFLDAARPAVSAVASIAELAAAETLYAGEYLDDEPYASWAVGLREEARSLYLRVAQRLAEELRGAGQLEHAGHLYLRLLQRDPYDEAAHLALVRVLDEAGHRGEARRAYRTYSARMSELEVEPAPYP